MHTVPLLQLKLLGAMEEWERLRVALSGMVQKDHSNSENKIRRNNGPAPEPKSEAEGSLMYVSPKGRVCQIKSAIGRIHGRERRRIHRVRRSYRVHAPLRVLQCRPARQSPNRRDSSVARHTQIALIKPSEQVGK